MHDVAVSLLAIALIVQAIVFGRLAAVQKHNKAK